MHGLRANAPAAASLRCGRRPKDRRCRPVRGHGLLFPFANAGHPDGDPCKRETKASGERVNSRYNPRFPGDLEMKKAFPVPVRVKYSCAKCPAYCCSYPEIEVTPRDIERLARQFGLDYRQAEERFTKCDPAEKVRLLRHRKDRIFDSVCVLLDQETRRCTAYGSRPAVCSG